MKLILGRDGHKDAMQRQIRVVLQKEQLPFSAGWGLVCVCALIICKSVTRCIYQSTRWVEDGQREGVMMTLNYLNHILIFTVGSLISGSVN